MPSSSEAKKEWVKWYMSWEDVHEAMATLLGTLKEADFVPEMIVGVGKGGIIPAVLIHQHFPEARFETIQVASYGKEFYQTEPRIVGALPNIPNLDGVLIVDDILETGATRNYLQLMYPKAKFAFMTCRQKMAGECIFRGSIVGPNIWAEFPWEQPITPNEVAF